MRNKMSWLFLGYLILYVLVRMGFHLPALIHGLGQMESERGSSLSFMQRLPELLLSFGFAIFPYRLLQYYYPKKEYWQLALCLPVAVVAVFLLSYAYIRQISPYPVRLKRYFINNLFFQSLYLLYGLLFYFIRFAQDAVIRQKELLIRSREAELNALRSQVNPHFLFNQLNSIYALVFNHSAQALPAIAGLSDILRYTLYESENFVSIEKEVVYLEKYIDLQHLRFGEDLKVNFEVSGETNQLIIAPLLFLPFVENAFKHGKEFISIKLTVLEKKLEFSVTNTVVRGPAFPPGGLGIVNVRNRLELIYPNKHRLEITQGESQFTVNLYLELP